MAISQEYNYSKPENLKAALDTLADYKSRAKVLAGGTDIINTLKDDGVSLEHLLDIKGMDELREIKFENDVLNLGPLVTFNEIMESDVVNEKFPLLFEMSKQVASHGLRNRATIGGNICSAVPCCDSGAAFLLYEAEVTLRSATKVRTIPISEFFVDVRKTALDDDELLVNISLKYPGDNTSGAFVKLRRYKGEDLAQASVSILALSGTSFRIALGSVSPTPVRALKLEDLLRGQALDNKAIEEAKKLVLSEMSPITDLRASKEYREHMVQVMLERALKAVVLRLRNKGPKYGEELI